MPQPKDKKRRQQEEREQRIKDAATFLISCGVAAGGATDAAEYYRMEGMAKGFARAMGFFLTDDERDAVKEEIEKQKKEVEEVRQDRAARSRLILPAEPTERGEIILTR